MEVELPTVNFEVSATPTGKRRRDSPEVSNQKRGSHFSSFQAFEEFVNKNVIVHRNLVDSQLLTETLSELNELFESRAAHRVSTSNITFYNLFVV